MKATGNLFVLAAVAACGCGDGETAVVGGQDCAPDEYRRDDGQCVAVGLPPDLPCPPGQWLSDPTAACLPAGVPPQGCGAGFQHDGDRGCTPILPVDPCPVGMMAVPGDAACREVAPCEAGTWGGIPVEPGCQYVDQAYTGGSSNGTEAQPWTTVQQGIDAAAHGGMVAIAAGTYVEHLQVQGKAVRLWGQCPAQVELRSTGAGPAGLLVLDGASGTEIHRVAVSGPGAGIAVANVEDVVVDEVWIHGNVAAGLAVERLGSPTSLTLRRSLLENNSQLGVFVSGAGITVEGSVVRDTVPTSLDVGGRGIALQDNTSSGEPADAVVIGSVVERNSRFGLFVGGSVLTLDTTVVQDTLPFGPESQGISVQNNPTTGAPSQVVVRDSLLRRNHEFGMGVLDAQATVTTTVIRETLPVAESPWGGVGLQVNTFNSETATLTVERTLVEGNHGHGLISSGGALTLDGVAVRDTLPNGNERYGHAITAHGQQATGVRANLVVSRSLCEGSHEAAVLVAGADLTLETTVLRDTRPDIKGGGRALQLQEYAATSAVSHGVVRASLVEQAYEAGIMVSSSNAIIDGCHIRDVEPRVGLAGDGLMVWSAAGQAAATVTATRIERSARAGLASFGGSVAIENSLLLCQSIDIAVEPWEGQATTLDDRGGVRCGCPEATDACEAIASQMAPPPPTGGIE